MLLSSVAPPSYIRSSSAPGSRFSVSSPALVIFCILGNVILIGVTWFFLLSHISPLILFFQHQPWSVPHFELWGIPEILGAPTSTLAPDCW